jgi:hypothetical protein
MNALHLAATVAVALAPAASFDDHSFRYERTLRAATSGPIRFEPDGPLFEHSRFDLADLRVVDARGRQVPWRRLPRELAPAPVEARVLDAGRRGRAAVALLDFGPARRVRDRVDLDVPGHGFVAHVRVSGSNDRRTFTFLSTSVVYDISGPVAHARSTTLVFPPSDFRYLFVRANGISRIDGATAFKAPSGAQRIERRGTVRPTSANPTRLVLDLGARKLPVDQLSVAARTRRYDREALVEGSNDGRTWSELARTRIFRLTRSISSPIDVDARDRFLRLTIFNGDDEPLQGVRLRAFARSRALLVEGGHPGPLRLFYGNPASRPPSYDFARLPRGELGLDRAQAGRLGREALNPAFRQRPDTRSFSARHPVVITFALALAALVVASGGLLALRRRA